MKTGQFNLRNIQRRYRVWAKPYEWLTPIYLLGNESRLRKESVGELYLESGQSVLDVACGTGRNFPLILDKIGTAGTLVGVDYTPAMLERARERVVRQEWANVHLIHGDASRFSLDQQFDAALCTLALSVIPDYESALKVMVNHVQPGGRVAIADRKFSINWYERLFYWFANLLGRGAAADIKRSLWLVLKKLAGNFIYHQFFIGFFLSGC